MTGEALHSVVMRYLTRLLRFCTVAGGAAPVLLDNGAIGEDADAAALLGLAGAEAVRARLQAAEVQRLASLLCAA